MSIIRNLSIRNYKSVRQLDIACERINVFLGKPNAGKSNILEGISLLGAGYFAGQGKHFMGETIRYESLEELFFDFDINESIEISADQQTYFTLKANDNKTGFINSIRHGKNVNLNNLLAERLEYFLSTNGIISKAVWLEDHPNRVKNYSFRKLDQNNASIENQPLFLLPPDGRNFFSILNGNKRLQEAIDQFAEPLGYSLSLDYANKQFSFVKVEGKIFKQFPPHLLPDTFQRYIFHLAAILSNEKSVLLFEEPETHSYGPYVYQLAQEILQDEGENQYFLTTHNPYLLTPLLQEGKQDLAVFITWFEDYQTKVRRLEQDEIASILDHGYDIFMNLDNFIHADAS